MNIVVLVKQVPDTESVIKVQGDGKGIVTDNMKFVVNPYDEYAIEEALKIKTKIGSGEVTLLNMGPDRSVEAIRTGLAMGADKAIHIDDSSLAGADPITTAKVLAAALKGLSFDLILCGRQAIDDDSWTTGPALAEFLNIPHVGVVSKIDIAADNKTITATREAEGGAKEIFELTTPALLSATKGLNEPRYPSLPNIMKAKKKPVEGKNLAGLGLAAESVKAVVVNYALPPERKAGSVFKGEAEEVMVPKLVKALREQAKVI